MSNYKGHREDIADLRDAPPIAQHYGAAVKPEHLNAVNSHVHGMVKLFLEMLEKYIDPSSDAFKQECDAFTRSVTHGVARDIAHLDGSLDRLETRACHETRFGDVIDLRSVSNFTYADRALH